MSHPLVSVATRRRINGVRAADIAAALGMATESYRRIERGERRCYLDKAHVIAKMLGSTVDALAIEPTMEEKVQALTASENRRELLTKAQGDPQLADEIALVAEIMEAPAPRVELEPTQEMTETVTRQPDVPTKVADPVHDEPVYDAALAALLEQFGDDDDGDDGEVAELPERA